MVGGPKPGSQCYHLRSSPSTGRTWLNPAGRPTKKVTLANIFVMRMLYMLLGQVMTINWDRISQIQCICNYFKICLFFMHLVSLRLWYAYERGVHFLIEQPLTSVPPKFDFKFLFQFDLCIVHERIYRYSLTRSLWRNSSPMSEPGVNFSFYLLLKES